MTTVAACGAPPPNLTAKWMALSVAGQLTKSGNVLSGGVAPLWFVNNRGLSITERCRKPPLRPLGSAVQIKRCEIIGRSLTPASRGGERAAVVVPIRSC